MTNNILIKNIKLVNPATGFDGITDILIENGIISKIENNIFDDGSNDLTKKTEVDGFKIIDGTSLTAIPGLVDEHVHYRDPGFTHKEDIYTGAKAAIAGGFTSIVLMGNTNPKTDNTETIKYVIEKGKETGINIHTVGTVTKELKGLELTDMDELLNAGAIGFSDDGIPIMDAELLRKALVKAKELNVPVSLHEENPEFITNNGINSDVAKKLGYVGSPREAEISMIERDVQIAIETGADLNIQHISTKEGVEIIRNARKKALNIHAEATPHHFTLTEEAVEKYGTYAKMNPPLRKEEDRMAIIEGIKDGTIEIIATDHAPHSVDEKKKPLTEAPSGIIGLETSLSLGITELVKKGYLSLNTLVERMTVGPAKLYHLENEIASIQVGRNADICIFDENAEWIPGENGYKSKSENTPFTGWKLFGKIKYTICKGKIYEN